MNISIYTLSDLGDLSNLLSSLSRQIVALGIFCHYSPRFQRIIILLLIVSWNVCFDKVKVYLAFKPVWRYSTQSNNYIRYKWVKKNVKGLKTPTGMNKTTTEFGFRMMWRISVCRSQRMLSTLAFSLSRYKSVLFSLFCIHVILHIILSLNQ